jgi:signal-transduction protein with cAMP-binding, CBS, and nucleotidyltransferase domain
MFKWIGKVFEALKNFRDALFEMGVDKEEARKIMKTKGKELIEQWIELDNDEWEKRFEGIAIGLMEWVVDILVG